jgi:hypothetical protein
MSELMGQPEGEQLGIQSETLRVRIGDGREVLETGEGDPLSIDHEFAGVCCPDADHENNVYIDVLLKEAAAALLSRSGERDHVGSLEHLFEIGSICQRSRPDDVDEMGTFGIDDVILPVRLEETAVGFEVAMIGGDAVGATEYGEKIWQQVDQHSTGKPPAGKPREAHQRRGRRIAGASDAV